MEESNQNTFQRFLLIRLGDREFGLSLRDIREAIAMQDYTPVPGANAETLGIIDVRGSVMPLIDLAKKMKIPEPPGANDELDRGIVICKLNDAFIGIVVSAIDSVVALEKTEISAPPSVSFQKESQYIVGIVRRNNNLVLLLDPSLALTDIDLSGLVHSSGKQAA